MVMVVGSEKQDLVRGQAAEESCQVLKLESDTEKK